MKPQLAAAFLLSGSATQDLAFRMAQVALPLVVLDRTGSVALTGLVAGAEGLPVLVSPWWARTVRQWVHTGRHLTVVALLDTVALSVVPAAAVLDRLSAWVLVTAGLLLGIGETLGGPGRAALLTEIGDRLGPDRGVALLTCQDLLRRVGMVVGPGLGALAVAAGLTVDLLWLEAAAVLAAGLLAWPVPGQVTPETLEPSAPAIRPMLARRPDVLAGWLMRGVSCLTWFAFTLGLAVLGAQLGHPGILYGWGMVGYGAGSILGTLVAVRVVSRVRVLTAARVAWTVAGSAWVVMGVRPSAPVVAAAAALAGGFVVVGITAVNAAITRSSSGAARRTLLSGQTVVVSASSSAGMLVGGAVLAVLGVRATLVVAGLLVSVMALAVPVLIRRQPPGPGSGVREPADPGQPGEVLDGPLGEPPGVGGDVAVRRVHHRDRDVVPAHPSGHHQGVPGGGGVAALAQRVRVQVHVVGATPDGVPPAAVDRGDPRRTHRHHLADGPVSQRGTKQDHQVPRR